MFNPLTATATDVQALLSTGNVNSSQVVEVYLDQIDKYNDYLRAVISVVPRVTIQMQAERLDEERAAGKVRGPLHGIPILVKDNIDTHPSFGVPTTAGSHALREAKTAKNAVLVDLLVEAGAIILGKTNLSEFSNHKGDSLPAGWSAVVGQTQSPYVIGGFRPDDNWAGHSNAGGSSSGSAVGVAAGFAPISIGTETDGSLVMPATRAALYTIKPTIGSLSSEGIVPISRLHDSAGPMAKSAGDLANMLDVLLGPSGSGIPKGGFSTVLNTTWAELRVGTLAPEDWEFPTSVTKTDVNANKQMGNEIRAAYSKIERLAKHCCSVTNIPSPGQSLRTKEGHGLYSVTEDEFLPSMNEYLSKLESSPVRTLEELVEWNKNHSKQELPEPYTSQSCLIKSLTRYITDEEKRVLIAYGKKIGGAQGIDKALEENGIDVLLAPADSQAGQLASSSGYPVATLPLSTLELNGRPFGLLALTSANREATLIKVASAWEETFGPRKLPSAFQDKEKSISKSI